MTNSPLFFIVTLGCKINQYESQALREAWTASGATEASVPEAADVLLFNSCAVTAKAVSELRAAVRKLQRENPRAMLIITGCAAQVQAEELRRAFPKARIVSQQHKATLLAQPPGPLPVAPRDQPPTDDPICFPGFEVQGAVRARAVVKVQDGCTQRCTYCIVPSTRGRAVSRPPLAALAEVRRLLTAGWREVVLSGINLRQYGADLSPALDFWDLVATLERELAPEWAGRARLRLSSLDPAQLGAKALDVLGTSTLICPHLHLSLQSLAPGVLRRMGRGHYGPDDVAAQVKHLEGIWPVFGLGADILTGFPGETDDDFRQTLAQCEKLPLSYAHVFPYSKRPGTQAATLPDQIPGDVAKARASALRTMAADKKQTFAQRVATLPEVHIVLEFNDIKHGMSEHYAECRLSHAVVGAGPRDVVRVQPTAAAQGVVTVAPLAQNPAPAMDNTGELA